MTVPKPNIIIYHLQKFLASVLCQEKEKKGDKILIVYDTIIISKPQKMNFICERFR